jgi:hypothetical protein
VAPIQELMIALADKISLAGKAAHAKPGGPVAQEPFKPHAIARRPPPITGGSYEVRRQPGHLGDLLFRRDTINPSTILRNYTSCGAISDESLSDYRQPHDRLSIPVHDRCCSMSSATRW